ncbi:uncharacterized protein LOC142230898 [Haematobia irritans]|uniref:uncharacterized protein LOC142230898 n=1 Tax=Haematobia irritans TaxID=7368 RepID=UPI003F4F5C22
MAYVLRYISNLHRKCTHKKLVIDELSQEEMETAENKLITLIQKEMFYEDYHQLQNHTVVLGSSSLKSLNSYLEVGIIRARGRLENTPAIPYSARPIIMAKEHAFSKLVVDYYHRKFHHLNRETVISEIRQKFWIIGIKNVLKSVEAHCQHCKNKKSQPVQPQMGPLPIDRVTPYVRPFSYRGVDLFGPCYVTIRRSQERRWVAIFTCLTVRAIHLEIVENISTDSFILALKNFMNRRGVPTQFRSDNGTNFIGIHKELAGEKGFIDLKTVTSKLAPFGIKWIFNTPQNPSQGGAWERLVQSVKKVLAVELREKSPRLETSRSFLIEAENIVNSRPLTHLPISIDEPEPLTPNHFLLGYTNSTQTPSPYDSKDLCLRKQWKILKSLKDCWWKRWIQEYLPDLTRRTKWCLPSNPISVGSLVYIIDTDVSRSHWEMGRVLQLFPGKDGISRTASVQTEGGVMRRPISKLAIIETN